MHSSLFSARALVWLAASHSSSRFPQSIFVRAAPFGTTSAKPKEESKAADESKETKPKQQAKKPAERKPKIPAVATSSGSDAEPVVARPKPPRKKTSSPKTRPPSVVDLSETAENIGGQGSERVTTISSVVPTLDGASLDAIISTAASVHTESEPQAAPEKQTATEDSTRNPVMRKPAKSRSTRNLVTDTSFLKTEPGSSTPLHASLRSIAPPKILQQARVQVEEETLHAGPPESAEAEQSVCNEEATDGGRPRLTASELKQQQLSRQQAADRSRFRERMVPKAEGGMEYHGMPPQLAEKYPDPPRLTVDIAPRNLKVQNVRLLMKKKYWEQLRKEQHERCKYRCEICGGMGDRWPVELHEKWSFDDQNRRLRLLGMTSLCPLCHLVKHANLAKMQGKLEEVIEHLAGVNNWTLDESRSYVDYTLEMWAVRSKLSWQTDLSVVHKYIFVSKSDAKS